MGFRVFSLRVKLALVSFLLLTIPLIGFWYASQMQNYLLLAQEQALSLTAKAVATVLNERPDLFEGNILQTFDEQKEIHAYLLDHKINLDGLTDDWQNLLDRAKYFGADSVLENQENYEEDTLNFKHLIGKRGKYYYVLFKVHDDRIVYRERSYVSLNKSDHLQIAVQGKDAKQHDLYFLSPYESGWVNGHLMRRDPQNYVPERYEPNILAYWRETADGYTIELRLPVAMVKNDRISFAIGDVDDPETRELTAVVGTSSTTRASDLGFLLARSPKLETLISKLHSPDARIRIIDSRFRQRAAVGQYHGPADQTVRGRGNGFSLGTLLKPVYAYFSAGYKGERAQEPKYLSEIEDQDIKDAMRVEQPFVLRRVVADSDAEILIAGEPVRYGRKVMGAVLVEKSTDSILAEKNRIIERTITITLIVFLVGGLGLIAFASNLSGRIRKLAAQTENAIAPDGRIRGIFRGSSVQDEIGDLSRGFATLLKRLKDYNTYQEKMADNLEHEIRTPVAGISASLANLEKKHTTGDAEVGSHFSGIKDNIERIESMMANIREATSLQEALRKEGDLTDFDLNKALKIWVAGYRLTFPENSFILSSPDEPIPFHGDPSRIRQMLDKIIENGADFSAADAPITIELSVEDRNARIGIVNEGPELPPELKEQIFDSMVSIRKRSENKSHLGLGLYVARQIAEFHGGSIQAENRTDGTPGAVFSIFLPLP